MFVPKNEGKARSVSYQGSLYLSLICSNLQGEACLQTTPQVHLEDNWRIIRSKIIGGILEDTQHAGKSPEWVHTVQKVLIQRHQTSDPVSGHDYCSILVQLIAPDTF